MNLFYEICQKAGALVCHQIDSRTILIDGKQLPICARDTGIYIGMFISLAFLVFKKRWKCDKPPKLSLAVALCLLIIPMPIDGIMSYTGIWSTNNFQRIITGVLFGITIPLFLIPLSNYSIWHPNKKPSLNSWIELLWLVTIALIICIFIYFDLFANWWSVSLILIATFVFMYFRLFYTIIVHILDTDEIYRIVVSVCVELCFFAFLYALSKLLEPYIELYKII